MNSYHKNDVQIQLHEMFDSSVKGYPAVTYLRVVIPDIVFLNFIVAKTKIIPIKSQTLPRIEISSVLLEAKLCSVIIDRLLINFDNIYLWTDSQIFLTWLKSPPLNGNKFVINRVCQITSVMPSGKWNHIPGNLNLADSASRGFTTRKLLHQTLS